MKKFLIVMLIWFVVASFFYAAIWTNKNNTLSDCWMFTGIVAFFQVVLTCAVYPLTQNRRLTYEKDKINSHKNLKNKDMKKQYIDKAAVVAMIKKLYNEDYKFLPSDIVESVQDFKDELLTELDTLEVIDPYEQCIQYDSVKTGIKAHAETYSFNIESKLFNQLTREQQELWREEIEQACISGGDAGVELARDPRYKENLEVKEMDIEKEFDKCCENYIFDDECDVYIARKFFELGIKAQKGE